MASHLEIGKNGEAIALAFLKQLGFQILEQNWRYNRAEIDIIAKWQQTLVFVEVKTRTKPYFGNPEDFVDAKKQKLIYEAATHFVELSGHDSEIRFDIVAIMYKTINNYQIKHIKDAFWDYDGG